MSDFTWFIITSILFVLLGLVFIGLGWQIWKKQKIGLIISYHVDKVSEDNKQAFCMLSGIGILIMGIGFIFSGVCTAFFQSISAFVPMTAGSISGIALLISAIMKYNH